MNKIAKLAEEFEEKLSENLLQQIEQAFGSTTGQSQRFLAAVVAIAAKHLSHGELRAAIRLGHPKTFEEESIDWIGGNTDT
ncbi:MAG: hypothetical protein ACXADB_02895 [Candidatus Hermodarchaeia archaeon]|jgi:hypothetical protein